MECKFLGFALVEDSETNRLKKVDLVGINVSNSERE